MPRIHEPYEDETRQLQAVWEGRAAPVEPGRERPGMLHPRGARPARPPVGPRARRGAVDAGAARPMARANWLPIGPRNVAGRVRALAVTPGRPDVWYAGAASGGVHKSTDRGQTWRRVWTAEPSLSIGAIAVATPVPADATRDRVYVATGEVQGLPGHGIWVSDGAGEPGTWVTHRPGDPPAANPATSAAFDAVAVHPTAPEHAWAVGVGGAYRTLNAGIDWVPVDEGRYWSDAHFSPDGRLFLARGGRVDAAGAARGRAVLVRLADPATADAAALAAAANVSMIVEAPAGQVVWPSRVKFAIATSDPNTIYVRVVDDDDRHVGVFRTLRADRPTADFQWQRLADAGRFWREGQGNYDLCIAVHPTDRSVVATGMVDLHVSRDAAGPPDEVTWVEAMVWELHASGLRAHHADHHQLVTIDDELWVANDGGISMCADWTTEEAVSTGRPLAHDAMRWVPRDDGISASQMYDVNQHPALPSVVASGFQDSGTHMTTGGGTWRLVHGGDGGFASFDPDDPYAMLTTTPEGIHQVRFPGHLDRSFPDEQPPGPPPVVRTLTAGFHPFDPAVFLPDTVQHPVDRGRVLHARSGRLYGRRSRDGEAWSVETVGRGLELRVSRRGAAGDNRLLVTLADTPGAHHLGLVPGTTDVRRHDDADVQPSPLRLTAAFVARLPAPYHLVDGDELRITVEGDPATHVIRFTAASAAVLDQATLAEVVAVVAAAHIDGVEALPRLWDVPRGIELITRQTGAAASIALGGTALSTADAPPLELHGLSRLGINPGIYRGAPGRPASVTLGHLSYDPDDQRVERDLSVLAGPDLTVAIDGGPPRPVDLTAASFPDLSWITSGELARALSAALANDPVDVVLATAVKYVEMLADPGRTLLATGTAVERLGLRPVPAARLVLWPDPFRQHHLGENRRNHNSFDLTSAGPALTLRISDGTGHADVLLDGTGVADLRAVTTEELHALVAQALGLAAPPVAATLALESYIARGDASELAVSSVDSRHLWMGCSDGRVERSTDDGATWSTLGTGTLDRAEARVEAIALHPTNADVAYVGHWTPIGLPAHHALIHRTGDGGTTWVSIGIVHGGRAVAVRALELHPEVPEVVFAATDNGVFWSEDEGATWAPFSEGLTGSPVIDLAVDPAGPHLVAGTWGAGAFERYIGVAAPDDVRLHVRASELDAGRDRPALPAPDLFAPHAAAGPPQSPDIAVTTGDVPASVADGVVFDLDIVDEAVPHEADVQVLVQVHNRGSLPARTGPGPADPKVRVAVLRTNVADAPPDLPPDFWATYRSGALAGNVGDWNVVFDQTLTVPLVAGSPAIVRGIVTGPARVELPVTGPRFGVLVIVSHPDDELAGGHTEIGKLVASERRCAYREVDTVTPESDVRCVLRSLAGRQVAVLDTADHPSSAAARLRFTSLNAPATSVAADPAPAGTATYDLGLADAGLSVSESLAPVTITIDGTGGAFADVRAVRPAELARFLDRRLAAAGVPVFSQASADHLRLRALGDATVEVTGGSATGGSRFNFAPAGQQAVLTSPSPTVGLAPTAALDLVVRAQGTTHNLAVAIGSDRRWEHADIVNRQLALAGLDRLVVAEAPVGLVIAGDDANDHEVSFTLGGSAVTDPPLSLPAGPHRSLVHPLEPVDLSAGAVLTVEVTNRTRARFRNDATMTGAEVRRTINRALEDAGMAVRAEPAATGLHLGVSSTDPGTPDPRAGGAGLAEIVTSGTAAVGDPPALFDARAVLGADRLTAAVANEVYVRATNRGNVPTDQGRFRLFRIELGAPVVTPHAGPTVAHELPAGAAVIANLQYTPTAADVELVLAVIDEDRLGHTVDPPATWPDSAALLAWVDARPGAALRRFDVSP